MNIGKLHIEEKAALAPMAGYTDRAFRELCIGFGAGFAVSEMVSTKAIVYNDKKTMSLMNMSDIGFPQGIQLFGNNPSDFEKASYKVLEFSPYFIDINMGCPVPKIVSSGSGSALMNEPKKCFDIVRAVKNSVGDLPVTVKIRKGWDNENINAAEVAKYCEQAGAAAVCIHARTKKQMYSGKADWDTIKNLKAAVKIPVIGNGDVRSATDAFNMLETTGCDMVLIGRGALGNPFIFREIDIQTKRDGLVGEAKVSEKLFTMLKHIKALCDYKGERIGMKEARKHACYYIKGLKNSAKYRQEICKIEKFSELEKIAFDIMLDNSD